MKSVAHRNPLENFACGKKPLKFAARFSPVCLMSQSHRACLACGGEAPVPRVKTQEWECTECVRFILCFSRLNGTFSRGSYDFNRFRHIGGLRGYFYAREKNTFRPPFVCRFFVSFSFVPLLRFVRLSCYAELAPRLLYPVGTLPAGGAEESCAVLPLLRPSRTEAWLAARVVEQYAENPFAVALTLSAT